MLPEMTRKDAEGAESAARERGSALYLAAICLVASIGGLLFGFDTAVISGVEGLVTKQYQLSPMAEGLFTTTALAGCILGAAVAGALGDRYGRRRVLLAAAAFFLLSSVGCALAPDFWTLAVARLLVGVGIGLASVVAPMYITEFSPPQLRGRLVATFQLSIVIGILVAYLSNWLLASLADYFERAPGILGPGGVLHWLLVSEVWRSMLLAGAIPAVVFLGMLALVPESPRWLATNGRTEESLAVFSKIFGPTQARQQLHDVQNASAREEGSWAELLKPGLRTALLVGVLLSVFGQLSGVNIVVYYGPKILEAAGFRDVASLVGQVGIGIVNLVFTIIAMTAIDRWGRRPLLIRGMAAVTVSLVVIGAMFLWGVTGATVAGGEVHVQAVSRPMALAIAAMIAVYMACEALSICAVIWVITPEIFPNRVRGRAVSVATFANWGTNAVGVWLFPWYVGQFGMYAAFFTLAAVCLVGTSFFWLMVPETKGKTLEEIESCWSKRGRS